tara:strand:- start:86 stop:694 length:609 start_codon:yes stop_codon:yes gene_type:complete
MSFTKQKYQVIKNAVSKELIKFIFDYFILKRKAVKYMYENNYVHETATLGFFGDKQVPDVYVQYADFAMETLLTKVMPIIKKETKLSLIPTYSYARIYEKGSILHRHTDRPSCEVSTTLNLGGDSWPIFLDPTKKKNKPGIKIDLKPGDMLVYSGCELEHWREKFKGDICAQVFLHYNYVKGKFKDNNLYDKRPLLGIQKFE